MNQDKPWLAHYDANVPKNIEYEFHPVFNFLDQAAEQWPSRTAILFRNYKMNYKRLCRMSQVVAANLRAAGVRPGDKVAIMLPNLPQTVISYWGALRAGAVVVMTNPLYMETEIVHQMNDSGARFLITLDLLWPKISVLRDRLPLEKYFVTSIADGLKFPLKQLYTIKTKREGNLPEVGFNDNDVLPWTDLTLGKKTFTCKGIIPTQDMALLQYTGGTTGVSKGCIITHANLSANVQQCRTMLYELGNRPELFISVLPFFHIYGLTVCLNLPTLIGGTMALFPRYVPGDLLKAIHKHKPTVFPGAPAVYGSLLQQKDLNRYNLKSIDICVSGSAPLPMDTYEKFQSVTGANIVEGYGLTEASPVTHFNPLRGQQKPGSIGLPFPDTEAKIVDMVVGGQDGLPPGKVGELVVKGPQVMKGYYNRPSDTADVLRNGWLYTGDVGYMDEEGYFFIVDRKKDLIISSGYNIYPREIDEVLYAHPKIKEAVAVGIPHPTRGEIVKVYVVLEDGEAMKRGEVIAYCRGKLASFKVPRQVEFRDELPKTMVGKVLRRALRDEEEQKTAEAAPSPKGAPPADPSLDPDSEVEMDRDRADLDSDAG